MSSEVERRLDILDVVAKHCLFTGIEKAAMELHEMGVSRSDFVETMRRCPTIPSDIECNIQNGLSNLERGLNIYRPYFNYKQVRRRLRESLKPNAPADLPAEAGKDRRDVRLSVDRSWAEYPIGTRAHAYNGGWWERVDGGWKPNTSKDVFPTPGGDAVGKCIELPNAGSHRQEEGRHGKT